MFEMSLSSFWREVGLQRPPTRLVRQGKEACREIVDRPEAIAAKTRPRRKVGSSLYPHLVPEIDEEKRTSATHKTVRCRHDAHARRARRPSIY